MWRRVGVEAHTVSRAPSDWVTPDVLDADLVAGTLSSARSASARSNETGTDRPQLRFQQAIEEFSASHTDSVIPAERMINPLLDLWSLAVAVDHSVTAPIEALLKVLVVRTTTTSAELLACTDQVKVALAEFLAVRHPTTV